MKPKHPTLVAPPVDLKAAFLTRIGAVLDHLRAELAEDGDLLLAVPRTHELGTENIVIGSKQMSEWSDRIASERFEHPRLLGRWAAVGTNPRGLPLPLSVGVALDLVERDREPMAAELAGEVRRCTVELVDAKLASAVLARSDVAKGWPWNEDTLAGYALCLLLAAVRNYPPNEVPGGEDAGWARADLSYSDYWPGEAAPLEVARWARDGLNRIAAARAYVSPDRMTPKPGDDRERWSRNGPLEGWTLVDGEGRRERYPATGMALLYLAEREVKAGLRRPAMAIDAGKPHHKLLTGWKSIPRDGIRHRAAAGAADIMDGRVELLLPGTATQLALPLPLEGLSASAVALLRELRGAAGLRHWCALQRLLSVEGGRLGWVRWTLDEHLEAMGYGASTREDPTKRAEAAAAVEELTKLELVVYDTTNTLRYRAPLLMVGGRFERIAGAKWALEGMELKINELLYQGVRAKAGGLGTNWMPAPVELAKLDHARHPYAHGLGMLLAIRMRWDIGNGRALRLTGRKLLDLAGIPYAERRAKKAWDKLERELDALEKVELLTYRWDADPWTLAAVCEVEPAGWMMDRVGRGLVPVERPPASIPRTGAELLSWRAARGWSQRAAAGRLGVSQQALSKAEAKAAGELGAGVLDALKRLAVTTKRGGSPPE